MDFPRHIDLMGMGLLIVYFKGSQSIFLDYDIFLPLNLVKVVVILANSGA